MKTKITPDQVQDMEAESIIDALGDCLVLDDDFLAKYAGEELKAALLAIPEDERAFHLDGYTGKATFNGGISSLRPCAFLLPSGEIEFPFEGPPEEVFEDPSDFAIADGSNLAYLYTGYGLTIEVDVPGLVKDYQEWIND